MIFYGVSICKHYIVSESILILLCISICNYYIVSFFASHLVKNVTSPDDWENYRKQCGVEFEKRSADELRNQFEFVMYECKQLKKARMDGTILRRAYSLPPSLSLSLSFYLSHTLAVSMDST